MLDKELDEKWLKNNLPKYAAIVGRMMSTERERDTYRF